ncbi:hypothetical protein BLNAU_11524 [Blattamonas nauphoetae]|uniref:Uncharacterized protein n=1 Tax=Blattamonas nauphoetae TaxID=2049346 RepID=A0ABQ9XP48_9EUKA|nr:hypothetical protein BLNAU_11524 [Blattamonas nauphoetae]
MQTGEFALQTFNRESLPLPILPTSPSKLVFPPRLQSTPSTALSSPTVAPTLQTVSKFVPLAPPSRIPNLTRGDASRPCFLSTVDPSRNTLSVFSWSSAHLGQFSDNLHPNLKKSGHNQITNMVISMMPTPRAPRNSPQITPRPEFMITPLTPSPPSFVSTKPLAPSPPIRHNSPPDHQNSSLTVTLLKLPPIPKPETVGEETPVKPPRKIRKPPTRKEHDPHNSQTTLEEEDVVKTMPRTARQLRITPNPESKTVPTVESQTYAPRRNRQPRRTNAKNQSSTPKTDLQTATLKTEAQVPTPTDEGQLIAEMNKDSLPTPQKSNRSEKGRKEKKLPRSVENRSTPFRKDMSPEALRTVMTPIWDGSDTSPSLYKSHTLPLIKSFLQEVQPHLQASHHINFVRTPPKLPPQSPLSPSQLLSTPQLNPAESLRRQEERRAVTMELTPPSFELAVSPSMDKDSDNVAPVDPAPTLIATRDYTRKYVPVAPPEDGVQQEDRDRMAEIVNTYRFSTSVGSSQDDPLYMDHFVRHPIHFPKLGTQNLLDLSACHRSIDSVIAKLVSVDRFDVSTTFGPFTKGIPSPLQAFGIQVSKYLKHCFSGSITKAMVLNWFQTFKLSPSFTHVLFMMAVSLAQYSTPLPKTMVYGKLKPSLLIMQETSTLSLDIAVNILLNLYTIHDSQPFDQPIIFAYCLARQHNTGAFSVLTSVLTNLFLDCTCRSEDTAHRYYLNGRHVFTLAVGYAQCDSWDGLNMALHLLEKLQKTLRDPSSPTSNRDLKRVWLLNPRNRKDDIIPFPESNQGLWEDYLEKKKGATRFRVDLSNIQDLLSQSQIFVESWMEEGLLLLLSEISRAAYTLGLAETLAEECDINQERNPILSIASRNSLVFSITESQMDQYEELRKEHDRDISRRERAMLSRLGRPLRTRKRHLFWGNSDQWEDSLDLSDFSPSEDDTAMFPFLLPLSEDIITPTQITSPDQIVHSSQGEPPPSVAEPKDTDSFGMESDLVEEMSVVQALAMRRSKRLSLNRLQSIYLEATQHVEPTQVVTPSTTASRYLRSSTSQATQEGTSQHIRSQQSGHHPLKNRSSLPTTPQIRQVPKSSTCTHSPHLFAQHSFPRHFQHPQYPTSHFTLPDYLLGRPLRLDIANESAKKVHQVNERINICMLCHPESITLSDNASSKPEEATHPNWPILSKKILQLTSLLLRTKHERDAETDKDIFHSDDSNDPLTKLSRLWTLKYETSQIALEIQSSQDSTISHSLAFAQKVGISFSQIEPFFVLEKHDGLATTDTISVEQVVALSNLSLACHLQHSDTKAMSAYRLFQDFIGSPSSSPASADSLPKDIDEVWRWTPWDNLVATFIKPFHNFSVFLSSLSDLRSHLLCLNTLILLLRTDPSFAEGWNTLGVLLSQHRCFRDAVWIFELGRAICEEGIGLLGFNHNTSKLTRIRTWLVNRVGQRNNSTPAEEQTEQPQSSPHFPQQRPPQKKQQSPEQSQQQQQLSHVMPDFHRQKGLQRMVLIANQTNALFLSDLQSMNETDMKYKRAVCHLRRESQRLPQSQSSYSSNPLVDNQPASQKLLFNAHFTPFVPDQYRSPVWPDNNVEFLFKADDIEASEDIVKKLFSPTDIIPQKQPDNFVPDIYSITQI